MTLYPGQTLLGRYQIKGLLGEGGMGAVYQAFDTFDDKSCAVKEFRLGHLPSEQDTQLRSSQDATHDRSVKTPHTTREAAAGKFEQEAKLLSRLDHPHLPKVTNYFQMDNNYYLVMTLITGQDLAKRLEEVGGPLPEQQVLGWMMQVMDALEYIHGQDPPIIHRDIKPANIVVDANGQAFLVDFGIAKPFAADSRRSAVPITTGFSPIEQYGNSGRTDVRSDIYSLGASLYTLLTGNEPTSAIDRVSGEELVSLRHQAPEISLAVDASIVRALSISPDDRFGSVAEMRAAMKTSGAVTTYMTRPPVLRNRDTVKPVQTPSARVPMQINQYSTAGKREHNEDTLFAELTPPSGALLIIADGLGGHANGKVASELACDTVRRLVEQEDPATFVVGGHDLQKPELMQAFLYDVVRQANAMVWHEARQQGTDMQSTLLVVLLTQDTGYAGHVGDGALFVSGAGSSPVTKLTSEHRRGSSLTRTLGADEQVTPDILSFSFNEQSALVMGCDGFWEHVPSERIMRTLQDWPAFCVARELGRAALEAGSQDNVSVVVVTGDSFVTRYAANQMRTYASTLALRGDDPETIADRREFLAFCAQHATASSQTPSLMAQTLARIPDNRQYWETLQSQLSPEIRQRVTYLMAPERPTSVELSTPLVSSQAGTPALDSARPSVSTADLTMPASARNDDIARYVKQLEQMIVDGNYYPARNRLRNLMIVYPEARPTLVEWLRQQLTKPGEAASRIQEETLWDEYQKLAPDDIDTACAYAEKLWYHSRLAAWRIFSSSYQYHPSHRERIAGFLHDHGAAEDSMIVTRFLELASQPDVRGPGIAWALKAHFAIHPKDAKQLATDVLRDWPPSQDTEEIRQWLHPSELQTKPADSMMFPTEGAPDSLTSLRIDIARLKRDLTTAENIRDQLRQKLDEANQTLGERERTIGSLQDRVQLFIDNTKILGSMMLKFRVEYPEQALKLWPQSTWQSWEDYFVELGVRPPSRSVAQPESKRPWSRR